MKYLLIIPALAIVVFTSCNQAELTEAKNQNDSLLAVLTASDTELNQVLTAFNDIEANLDSVAAKQGIITKDMDPTGELKISSADKINAQISDINNLMNENRKKIEELNKKLKLSGRSNSQLKKSIEILKSRIAKKDQELTQLNEQLATQSTQIAELNTSVETLTKESEELTETIEVQTQKLNTGYYVIGNSKELRDANVIDRTGGLLGIGKTSKISDRIDHTNFTKIDITEIKYIPVHGKKVNLVTNHPSESYTLEYDKEDENLIKGIAINSEEQFWSVSNYLVVEKD